MRKLYLAFSLFIIFFLGILGYSQIKNEYLIHKNGIISNVKVISVSLCFGKKARLFFELNQEIHEKYISCSFAQKLKQGETLQLKHLPGGKEFLWPTSLK